MPRKLRVMWDYDAENPIWDRRGGIGLEGLGLSEELCVALRQWSAALTKELWEIIQTDDEALTPEAQRLDAEGRRLAEACRPNWATATRSSTSGSTTDGRYRSAAGHAIR